MNARLLAGVLNEKDVREALKSDGIDIPEDTIFVPALHDTTTDAVILYDQDVPAARGRSDMEQLRKWLAAAGRLARTERAGRLPRAEMEKDVADSNAEARGRSASNGGLVSMRAP